MTIAAH